MDIDEIKKKKKRKLKRKLEKNDEEKKADESLNPKSNDDQDFMKSEEETVVKEKKRKKQVCKLSLDCYKPPDEELSSQKNENVKDSPKKLSKKEKAIQREKRRKERQLLHKLAKVYSYVMKWKEHRHEWKFEKLKQIWLMDNMMFEHITNDMFPNIMEYFKECKGSARQVLIEKALKVVKKAEEETNEENKEAILKSVTYNRARQVLQTLT